MIKNPFHRGNPYAKTNKTAERFSKQNTPLGFVQTVDGELSKLAKDVDSLGMRINYQYGKGDPCAYVGERIFKPENGSTLLDIFQDGNAATTQPVNVVVPSGQEFSIPIILQGPGVFLAKYLTVTLYQRYFDPATGEQWLPLPYGKPFFNVGAAAAFGPSVQTIKWGLMYELPTLAALAFENNNTKLYGTNFFWNFVDEDSQRRLADDLIPDQALFPQGYQHQGDGNLCEMEWLFERASTVTFRMQVLNDILQLDPSSVDFPVTGVDDRENGTRNQSVKVRVELHGQKFQSMMDTILREVR